MFLVEVKLITKEAAFLRWTTKTHDDLNETKYRCDCVWDSLKLQAIRDNLLRPVGKTAELFEVIGVLEGKVHPSHEKAIADLIGREHLVTAYPFV